MILPVIAGRVRRAFAPTSLGTLLAEYDCVQGADAAVLYDKKPGGGANGVTTGCTYTTGGVKAGATAANFIKTALPWTNVRTIIVALTPISNGLNVFSSQSGAGVTVPLFADFSGSVAQGDLGLRWRDLNTGGFVNARHNVASWPYTFAFTRPSGAVACKQYANGVEASLYDFQSNGNAFAPDANVISFGNNFASTGNSTSLVYGYVLLFSSVLTAAQVAACHAYMMGKVNARGVAATGPVTLSGDLLCLTGNSVTNLINVAEITPTVPFNIIKQGFGGATPSQVILLARQATQPLKRSLATRNYLVLWPTPNIASAQDIDDYVVPYALEMRGLGWKVAVPTCLSYTGGDVLKNQINARYDVLMGGGSPPFNGLIDLRVYPNVSADGAYSNLTHFSDGTHPTATAYTNYIDPGITAGVNALG